MYKFVHGQKKLETRKTNMSYPNTAGNRSAALSKTFYLALKSSYSFRPNAKKIFALRDSFDRRIIHFRSRLLVRVTLTP